MQETSVNTASGPQAAWYRALTLAERVALPKMAVSCERPASEMAMQKLQYWKEQAAFRENRLFSARLAENALAEEDLLALLNETDAALQLRVTPTPAWLTELAQILERLDFSQEAPKDARFAHCIWPLIADALNRLRAKIALLMQEDEPPPIEPETFISACTPDLLRQINMLVGRTMVLELHVARLLERLHGETTEERFADFVQLMRQKENLIPLLEEYAVMTRLVLAALDLWVNYLNEFLGHLRQDWAQIRTTFSPESDPGTVLEVQAGAGDTHRGGRSVIILKFSSGLKLVYKPRSIAIDVHFQELLRWLNAHGTHLPFRVVKLLAREHYGWSEFVEAQSCTSQAELARFYERQGAYLALLYTLEATDFHHENLIAAGEHPILIDQEAFFHPRIKGAELSAEELLNANAMSFSVLRVGLLPYQIMLNAELEGIDISGIGGKEGQQTPWPVPQWQDNGTDQMRLVRKKGTMIGTDNRPMLNGQDVDPLTYRADLLRGFTQMYRLLMTQREALLAGPLENFAHDEIRLILRPTQTYAELLFEGSHPDVLRDALNRDRFFDHLWALAEKCPYLVPAIPYERRDLHMGDVPIFLTTPSTRDVFTGQGEILKDFLAEPSFLSAKQRVQNLDEQDLQRQIWLIEASLATLEMSNPHITKSFTALQPTHTEASPERLMAVARAIGDHLSKLALREANHVNWLGLSLVNERRWALLPAGLNLYDGVYGIVLFLSYLGVITHEEYYTTLARLAFFSHPKRVEQEKKDSHYIGAFAGWGARIYALTHLGKLWHEPALWDEAEEMVARLPELIEQDQSKDIISGTAGCLLVLLALYHVRPSVKVREVAVLCGDHLLAQARQMEVGIAWDTLKDAKQPLTGFSHGAAGISFSLLALSALTGEARFRQAAQAAISYERSTFSAEQQNWPDFRPQDSSDEMALGIAEQTPIFMTTWCHGAPGIGLGRLASLQYLDEPALRKEIQMALATTLQRGFGSNHSLCHGDLGNLETVLYASHVLNNPEYGEQLQQLTAMILDNMDKHGWRTGIPLSVETPGLMTGLAGIGYQCLRLATPENVPSVLLLAPPVV